MSPESTAKADGELTSTARMTGSSVINLTTLGMADVILFSHDIT
jgi:hypothetical protein